MSVTVHKFSAKDWGSVIAVPQISIFEPSHEVLYHLEQLPVSLTLRDQRGKIVAHMGIRPLGADRAECWAILDWTCKNEFQSIHRVAKEYLKTSHFTRIEAVVECDFEAGHRWVKALGFELEAERMRYYYPDGKDCALYARVRGAVA